MEKMKNFQNFQNFNDSVKIFDGYEYFLLDKKYLKKCDLKELKYYCSLIEDYNDLLLFAELSENEKFKIYVDILISKL